MHITMFDEVGTATYALSEVFGKNLAFGDPELGWFIARPRVAVEAGPPTDQVDEVVDAIDRLRPERFIIDVQRGMSSPRWDGWRELLTTMLERLGYSVRAEVVNANDHRAAYLHKRLFFIGSRVDEPRPPRRRRPLAIADVLLRRDLPDWAYAEPLRVPRTAISTDYYAFYGRKGWPPLMTTHAERMTVLGLPEDWEAPSFASFADATPVQSYWAVLETNR